VLLLITLPQLLFERNLGLLAMNQSLNKSVNLICNKKCETCIKSTARRKNNLHALQCYALQYWVSRTFREKNATRVEARMAQLTWLT